jgi:hypothetical protein
MRETGNGGDARGGFGVEGRLLHGSGDVSSTAAAAAATGSSTVGEGAGRSENGSRSSQGRRCAGPICYVAVAHVEEMRCG